MGAVYLAEQQYPIWRQVALKVIKPGMDTREVIARFQSERQALALMDHSNIARVFDAGSGNDGRPYFAMEYVPGIPITEYCDQKRLTNHERLELFLPVCQAVQHAHQKGIIHRDIKPSNVLVSMQDGVAVPKVIDFGVAKAINQRLIEQTSFTEHGVLVGTPEYMSPEQADLNSLDVDTTSDIYSLGILLYELLVGVLPFDPKVMRRAGYDEMRRIIREEKTPRLTARLQSLGAQATEIATRRRTTPGGMRRQLRRELDWITLKAIEKDRSRRYASASELAADIRSHLVDQPVQALPPSQFYLLSKFLKANRQRIAIVALILVATWMLYLYDFTNLSFRSAFNRGDARADAANTYLAARLTAISRDNTEPAASIDELKQRLAVAIRTDPEISRMLSSTLAMDSLLSSIRVVDEHGETLAAADPLQAGAKLRPSRPFKEVQSRLWLRNLWNLMTISEDYSTSRTLGVGDRELFRVVVAIKSDFIHHDVKPALLNLALSFAMIPLIAIFLAFLPRVESSMRKKALARIHDLTK
jgi:hypothetical protein